MVSKKRQKYLDKLARKEAMKRTREEREIEINKINDQLNKINFPESLEGIKEFYKVCDDYIENGYSLQGKIKLVGFKRILKYMFGCNKGSPVDAMLEYNENV